MKTHDLRLTAIPMILMLAMMSLMFFPDKVFAVVVNVEFVSGPGSGEPISFVDDKGKETAATTQERRDPTGVVIFVPQLNLPDGKYMIKWRGRIITQNLGSGVNRVDFRTAGESEAPRNVFNLGTGVRFFSGPSPLGASHELRFEYSPAVSIGEGFWAHQLYVAFTTVPSVHIGSHKPFDNGSFQFKIRRASIIDVTAGLQTNWEYGPKIFGAETYGGYNFGLRYSRSWSTLKKLETPEPEFTEEKNFDRTDNAFGFDLGYRAWLQWDNGFWAGIRGGVAPIYTDFLNHGRSWEAQGNVGVFAGYSWR